MFKGKNILIEVLKMILISVVLSLGLIVFADYQPSATLGGMLFTSLTLLAAYHYTTKTKRPIVFTVVFVFYLCLGVYSWRYIEYKVTLTGILGIFMQEGTSIILFLSCMAITLLEIKDLIQVIKKRIDIWFPPTYILIFAAFIFLEVNDHVSIDLKRVSLFILSLGIIFVCFYKNDKKPLPTMYYEIPLKGYMSHIGMVLMIILVGIKIIPQIDYLPGARWIQQYNKNLVGDLPTSVKLDRRPSISEDVVFEVESEEPLYLREIAYSHYTSGEWRIDKSNADLKPINTTEFLEEYELFINISKSYLESKKITIPSIKTAYIYEVNNCRHFLTTNGLRGIFTNDNDILMAGDIHNICFQEEENKKQVGYTISYLEREPFITKMFEQSSGLQNRNRWLKLLEKLGIDSTYYSIEILMPDEIYNEFREKYTQVPEYMSGELSDLARTIVTKGSNDAEMAKSIETYLKTEGGYTYVYGAPQQDKTADPIYDFLFNQKQGICQDFASGMVLLCRSIGLPARYVCGYYSEEKSAEEKYIIRKKNAHAFVEVYISGYGWMLFDPTPSSNQREMTQGVGGLGGIIDLQGDIPINELIRLVYRLILPAFLLIILWLLAKVLMYIVWRAKLLRGKPEESIDHLLKKLIKLLYIHDYEILEGETYEQLSNRLLEDKIDIRPITRPYEAYYYGRKKITIIEVKQALKVFESLRRRKTWKRDIKKND